MDNSPRPSGVTTRSAPAKVNLYLEVTGRRPDGYHDLVTVFWPMAGLADELSLEPLGRPGCELRTGGAAGVPETADNLVCRAAAAFAVAAAVAPAWRFTLTKRIPVAAGLGGGSSDAAAALMLLNAAHGTPLAPDTLAGLAAGLGADVPFFLRPEPALATGIGEQLTPLTAGVAALPLLLVNPGFPLPTAWAYGALAHTPRPLAPPVAPLLQALALGDAAAVAAAGYNAFEYPAVHKFPLLRLLLEFLRRRPEVLGAQVSGSGPTLFAICRPGTPVVVAAAVRAAFGPAPWLWWSPD